CLPHEGVRRRRLAAPAAIGADMAYPLAMPGGGPEHGATAAILRKKSEGLRRAARTTIRSPDLQGGSSMPDPTTFNHDDRELLGELFTEHQPHLDKVLKRYIWNEHRREDFVQDVFIRVLQKWHLYDRQRPFWPWLQTVALKYLFAQARNRRWQA